MTEHMIDVVWKDGLVFDAHQNDQTVVLAGSAAPEHSARGVSPKQLLLTALAGCTGMDVASLLPKMRVPFSGIRIAVRGSLSEEHPKVYTDIHVDYHIGSTEEFRHQVEMAVEKSVTTYCGVHAMLAKAARITHSIHMDGQTPAGA